MSEGVGVRDTAFRAFWTATTVSGFGTWVTTIALQVLVVTTLHGTAIDVGWLNASRWLPYLLFGLVVGALVDRRRRKPLLVGTDFGRAVLLGLIPTLWLLGALTLPVVLAFVALFGALSLLNDSASMSYLPRIVAPRSLLVANARLDQSASAAQTSGPLVAGGIVSLLGAPVAVLVDAVSYLFSGIVIARIRVTEPPPIAGPLRLRRDIAAGLRFSYSHRTLAPLVITGHVWFVFNSMLGTVFVPFVLLGLRLTPLQLGIPLAAAGIGGLVGALGAPRLGMRFGAGPVVILGALVMPLSWAVIALAPATHGTTLTVVVLAVGQLVFGLCLGIQNANEMGYRQSVVPDALQGRVNTTVRSINRAAIVVGAPLGGILADEIGYRPTLWIATVGFAVVGIALAVSPFRHARHGDSEDSRGQSGAKR